MTTSVKRCCAMATLAVCAAVAAVVAVEGGDGPRVQAQASRAGDRLDAYPGFGRTPPAARRDDTIAAWEAFRRERHVAGCMQRAGFAYISDIPLPEEALREIARSLGVTTGRAPAVSPADANEDIRSGLSAAQRNAYYPALFGETAQAVADAEANDGATASADFASGGCVAEADATVGSVWSTYRHLQDEMDTLHQQAVMDAGPTYATCTRKLAAIEASDPGELESRIDDPSLSAVEAARVQSAFEDCMGVWEAASSAAETPLLESFVASHADALDAQRDRYATAVQTLSADSGFREFLAASLASP